MVWPVKGEGGCVPPTRGAHDPEDARDVFASAWCYFHLKSPLLLHKPITFGMKWNCHK
jgi:hypothetical protein